MQPIPAEGRETEDVDSSTEIRRIAAEINTLGKRLAVLEGRTLGDAASHRRFRRTNARSIRDVVALIIAIAVLVVLANVPVVRGQSLVDALFIDANGNVGIGTTDPSAKLEVVGSVLATNLDVGGTVQASKFMIRDKEITVDADPPCFDDTNRYVDCGNGTVTDTQTGLIWLRDASCLGERSWAEANLAAASLMHGSCDLTDNSSPGDWRLPTEAEWRTTIADAVEKECDEPALTDTTGNACFRAGPQPFSGILPKSSMCKPGVLGSICWQFWTGSTCGHVCQGEDIGQQAWAVHLDDWQHWGRAGMRRSEKGSLWYVWPVRDK